MNAILQLRSRRPLAALLLMLAAAPGAYAAEDYWTVEAFAVSEPSYRGLTEARGRPALGASIEWNGARDAFVGASAQASKTPNEQQRERSALIYAGWQRTFSNRLSLALSVTHREFPGSEKEWDFTEFHAAFGWTERWDFELSYSPDYYEHDTRALTFSTRTMRPLSRQFFASAEVGAVEMSAGEFTDYQFASVGVGYRKRHLVVEASFSKATNEGRILFGEVLEAPGLGLQVAYLLH